MRTQQEIYNTIYKSFKLQMLLNNCSDDTASRKANIWAVKYTWVLYNDQFRSNIAAR